MPKKAKVDSTEVKLGRIKKTRVAVKIKGVSPLIQHAWDEKSRNQILDGKMKKKKVREVCDPEAEFKAAHHHTADGGYGVPAQAIKNAIIGVAHKDIGIEKTLVRKGVYILCDDPKNIISMQCSEPLMREDFVRVGQGSTDLRWRPEFQEWELTVEAELTDLFMNKETFVNLLDLAGSSAGIGEWRPEKGGDYGRFEVVRGNGKK
jgi:hypothetical protein